MTDLARMRDRALELALGEDGTHETPPGSNDGARIREYLSSAGVHHPAPWCVAFVQWCYQHAASPGPLPFGWRVTGSAHRFWEACAPRWGFGRPTPGAIALHDAGHGLGHAGIVLADGRRTIEGNTDRGGSRTGGSVMIQDRPAGFWNLGFIDIGRGDP